MEQNLMPQQLNSNTQAGLQIRSSASEAQIPSSLNISVTTKTVIDNGLNQQIRTFFTAPDWEAKILDVKHAIIQVLAAYSGASPDKTNDMIYTECLDLTTNKFNDLSIGEIKEAYRLVADGTLDVDVSAYHGIASVVSYGKVLAAYRDHRNKYLGYLQDEERKAKLKEDEEKAANDLKKKQEYQDFVLQWFGKNKKNNGASISLRDVPWYYYDTLNELSLIQATQAEVTSYKERAMAMYMENLKNKPERNGNERGLLMSLKDLGLNQTMASMNTDMKSIIINNAKSMFLYDLIKKGNPPIELPSQLPRQE